MVEENANALEDTGQYVSFILAGEEYGIPIKRVQEIIRFERLTAVPQAPHFMRGVLNLRGRVIPIIDLRVKFGMMESEQDRHTRIIVVEVGNRTMGMIVDQVSEVITVPKENIDPPPPLGASIDTEFISGMGKVGDSLVILLDIDRILSAGEMETLTDMSGV